MRTKQKPYTTRSTTSSRHIKPLVVMLAVILLTLIVVGGYLIHKHNRDKTTAQTAIPSTIETSQRPKNTPDNNQTQSSSSETGSPKSPSNNQSDTTDSSGTLTEPPSGTFVSNHKPNLSGSPAPSAEQSTCNTAPGATCYIKFTSSSGQVKQLSAEAAGNDGVVVWNWDVKTAGFAPGEWTIEAIATLNGVSKSTTDSLKLEVQP